MQTNANQNFGGQVDLSGLCGTWYNTNEETRWIARFELLQRDGAFHIHAFGVKEPLDWGIRAMTTYSDNIGESAFYTVYDLGDLEAVLAANTNKGLVIIAAFLNFKDNSGRANYLCREFFYRKQPGRQ